MKKPSNNEKFRNYCYGVIRSVIEPVNGDITVPRGHMYPGFYRTYCAVRKYIQPIMSSMGIPFEGNHMLTDEQFCVACGLVEKYGKVAIRQYLKHTRWNNGWQLIFADEDGEFIHSGPLENKILKAAKKAVKDSRKAFA